MDQNLYFQVLKDISDLLVDRYALQYSTLYWKTENGQFDALASFSVENRDQKDVEIPFSLSRSLIGAIRKSVFIPNTVRDLKNINEKPDRGDAYLLIVVPVKNENIHGMLAMWCKTDQLRMEHEDRILLDFVGRVILKNLEVYPTLSITSFGESDSSTKEKEVHFTTEPEVYEGEESIEKVSPPADDNMSVSPPFPLTTPENTEETEPKAPEMIDESLENKSEQSPVIDYIQYSSQGFMAFDKDCQIVFSNGEQLDSIFMQDLNGKNALDILFKLGTPSNPESTSFSANPKESTIYDLLTTIFMRITDLDVMIELLPSELDINNHFYRVEYKYIKADQVENDCILTIINDISREKKLQYQAEIESTRGGMISKVALDTGGYLQTKETISGLIRKLQEELGKPLSDVVIKKMVHQLRTIQMGVDIYDVKDISDNVQQLIDSLENMPVQNASGFEEKAGYIRKIEQLEELFSEVEDKYLNAFFHGKDQSKISYQITDEKLQSFYQGFSESCLDEKLKLMETIFDKNYRPFTRLPRLSQITNQRLERVKRSLWTKLGTPCKEELKELLESLKKQPVGLFFNRYAVVADNIAKKQNKQVEVKLEGDDIELSIVRYEPLFNSLIHVVRNSVEHGIEKMEERVFHDKELEGQLSFKAAIEGNQLLITIEDDGKGIDLEKIKKIAIACNLIDENEAAGLSQEDTLRLVFDLAARNDEEEEESEMIRGIGLDIVRQNVEKLNGKINIKTKSEKGTTIQICVPIE